MYKGQLVSVRQDGHDEPCEESLEYGLAVKFVKNREMHQVVVESKRIAGRINFVLILILAERHIVAKLIMELEMNAWLFPSRSSDD